MSEMIKRVAIAIRLRDTTDELAMARAAIEAMREPTDDMASAGGSELPDYDAGDDDAVDCWKRMIDEALK